MRNKFEIGSLVVITSKEGVPPRAGYQKPQADDLLSKTLNWGEKPLDDHRFRIGSVARVTRVTGNGPDDLVQIFPAFRKHHSHYGAFMPEGSITPLTVESLLSMVIPTAIASIGFGRKPRKP